MNDSRAERWNGGQPAPLSFAMMELAGEVGEACNAAKKLARAEMGWVGGDDSIEQLADELADTVICADLAASRARIDLADAVVRKFNATSQKHGFPERLIESGTALAQRNDAALRAQGKSEAEITESRARAIRTTRFDLPQLETTPLYIIQHGPPHDRVLLHSGLGVVQLLAGDDAATAALHDNPDLINPIPILIEAQVIDRFNEGLPKGGAS